MFRFAQARDLRDGHPLPRQISDFALFLVHEGDLHVRGSIELDRDLGWDDGSFVARLQASMQPPACAPIPAPATALDGLLINGHLFISDALVNASPDSGAALVVQGDLHARQASCGASCIRVGGNMRVDDVVYAHYNDGELHVGGTLSAMALINDDHLVLVGAGPNEAPGGLRVINLREHHDTEGDERIPTPLQKLISRASPLPLSSVLAALRNCRPIASLGAPQTPQEWVATIWKSPNAIRKLPKTLRTEEMYRLLLAPGCTLPELEVQELVSRIPPALLGEDVRMAAFLLSPRSLLRLPPEFDLHAEYARCLKAAPDPLAIAERIPAHLLPADWPVAP